MRPSFWLRPLMKTKFWQTKDFKKLEKEWYERLRQSNFQDIEEVVNGKSVLKQRASNCYRAEDPVRIESKRKYYELLSHHYHQEQGFRDEVEEYVMAMRAKGNSIEEISNKLVAAKERCYRGTIRKIIQKYETKWSIRRK